MVEIDQTSQAIGRLQATQDAVAEKLDRHIEREDADRDAVLRAVQEIRDALKEMRRDRDEVIQPTLDYVSSLRAKIATAVVIAGAAFWLVIEGIKIFGGALWKYMSGGGSH